MTIIIAVVIGVVSTVVMVLVWLIRKYLNLKRDYQVLTEIVHGNNNDIRELYTTALTVDERTVAIDEKLSVLSEKISAYPQNEPSNHPYSLAIQKVRSGASVSELMQTSGLSQDEATLLIRLHGSKAGP
jgi:hypothetical protein